MTEDEHYTDVAISDILDDTENEQFADTELQNAETSGLLNIQDSELLSTEDQTLEEKKPQHSRTEVIRSTRLPMARIKNIMKMDPDVSVVSSDAVFLVTKAAELFLETIAKETYSYTSTNKRKLISKKDLDLIINKVDCLCFLEGAMDF